MSGKPEDELTFKPVPVDNLTYIDFVARDWMDPEFSPHISPVRFISQAG